VVSEGVTGVVPPTARAVANGRDGAEPPVDSLGDGGGVVAPDGLNAVHAEFLHPPKLSLYCRLHLEQNFQAIIGEVYNSGRITCNRGITWAE
jgi:hypothetical protein